MGRLDDAAKLKVVELRKAGLSFRKIKAVLELENIKVSAQAIYLYLREFQGRPPGRVRPEDAGSSLATTQGQTRTGGQSEAWNNAQLQNLLREASHQAGRMAAAEFAKKSVGSSEARANSSGSCDARGGSSREQHGDKDKEEADIQIVSVTSLAQNSQQRDLQSTMMRARAVSGAESITTSVGSARRRVTPSPAINPVLAARKRLLDKALSHRTKSFQQMGPLLRRYQSSVSGDELRSAISRNPETYNLASEKSVLTGQPGGVNGPSRLVAQRPGLSARSPHPPPRVGVRFPTRAPAPLAAPAPGAPLIRLQAPGGQGVTRRDGNVSPQNAAMEAPTRSLGIAGGSGLQDQVQLLASEVRNLGLAVKMLVEQQSRLEREQVQQTRVQKQILGTLQGLSFRLGPCRSLQQQPDKTPTPPSQPTASASAPFGQDTFTYSQTTYTPCSQTQSNYNSIASLETVEAFKLPELSPSINGFPPCSNAETISNSYTQAQPYTSAYTQQHSQPVLPAYTQSFVQTYAHSNSQPFRGLESKASDFVSSCLEGSLQDCDIATELVMNSNHSPRNDQLNVIKVEEA